jgi:hypothetical protein
LAGKQPDGVGADVAGSSSDENRCAGWNHEFGGMREPENAPPCQLMGAPGEKFPEIPFE